MAPSLVRVVSRYASRSVWTARPSAVRPAAIFHLQRFMATQPEQPRLRLGAVGKKKIRV